MATSNYTPNLHLSAWAESDRPKRADFVSDNTIIDTQLGGHIANAAIHLTSAEKAKVTDPFVIQMYAGSGESSRTISLGFQPKLVLVFKRSVPFITYSGGVTIVNAACAAYGSGAAVGIGITSSGVSVTQTDQASDGFMVNLNESGSQYTLIAFK